MDKGYVKFADVNFWKNPYKATLASYSGDE